MPKSNLSDKQNKGSILKASVDYIRYLQRELVKARNLEDQLSQMTIKNKYLMEKVRSLESLKSEKSQSGGSLQSLLESPSLGNRIENMIKSDSTIVNLDSNLNENQINQFEQFISQREHRDMHRLDNLDYILNSEGIDEAFRISELMN